MENCLFCKIINGDIPSNKVYEDDKCFAFYDIDPQAPVHFLVVPKEHIKSAYDITQQNSCVISHIYMVIKNIATELGLESGYRVVTNIGEDGGQTVEHMHFHVLAKRSLAWPPG